MITGKRILNLWIDNNEPPQTNVVWIDASDNLIAKVWWLGKWQPLGCLCIHSKLGDFNNDFNNDFLN